MDTVHFRPGDKAIVVGVAAQHLSYLIGTVVVIDEIIDLPKSAFCLEDFKRMTHYLEGYRYYLTTIESRSAVTSDKYLRPIPPEKTTEWDETIFVPDDLKQPITE